MPRENNALVEFVSSNFPHRSRGVKCPIQSKPQKPRTPGQNFETSSTHCPSRSEGWPPKECQIVKWEKFLYSRANKRWVLANRMSTNVECRARIDPLNPMRLLQEQGLKVLMDMHDRDLPSPSKQAPTLWELILRGEIARSITSLRLIRTLIALFKRI